MAEKKRKRTKQAVQRRRKTMVEDEMPQKFWGDFQSGFRLLPPSAAWGGRTRTQWGYDRVGDTDSGWWF